MLDSLNSSQSFFFIGVAGSGMSAIAQYLSGKGFSVSGSDREFSKTSESSIRSKLEDFKIKCFPQDGSGIIDSLAAVVVSSAIEDTNADLLQAKKLGIPVMHRSEMLSLISKNAKTIAVSGTSGKSTVTGMIWHILNYAGFFPSLITGAGLVSLEKRGFLGNAVAGKGEYLVVEADESDGTLVRYSPEIGVILNIAKDHKEISELEKIFSEFSHNVISSGKKLIVNESDERAKTFSVGREFDFGEEPLCGVQGTDFRAVGYSIEFRVHHKGDLVKFHVPLPGRHNMENALAATAVALQVGVSLKKCSDALFSFEGIHRRHQILGTFNGVTVVDDFAHNPSKIKASILAAENFTDGKVIAYFQPHGFGPTRFLRNDLVQSISEVLRPAESDRSNDCIYFSEIYYAGGSVTKDISSGDLVDDLFEQGVEAHFIEDREECGLAMVAASEPGDTILIMGARDPSLSDFAKSIVKELEK